MDLCVVYGVGNGPLLSKMIKNIFRQQSKYEDDLRATVSTMLQVGAVLLSHCNQVIVLFYVKLVLLDTLHPWHPTC